MGWVAARTIIANMIENRNVFAFTTRDRSNKPSVHETMGFIANLVYSHLPVSFIQRASPNPAATSSINPNFTKDAVRRSN